MHPQVRGARTLDPDVDPEEYDEDEDEEDEEDEDEEDEDDGADGQKWYVTGRRGIARELQPGA